MNPKERVSQRKQRLVRPRWRAVRQTKPLSSIWGADRGTPIDRYYIERFLNRNHQSIHGKVLEIKHVFDFEPASELANIVVDLAQADSVPDSSFDCLILTKTLQFVYDVRSFLFHCNRILRPGGVLLCTVPSVSRIHPGAVENEYWRFTAASCRHLFQEAFEDGDVVVRSHGNVLTSVAFLAGIAAEELGQRKLDRDDDHFPLLLAVRAERAA